MTHGERFVTAMKNQAPDRVPVTPDISCYIPCKKQGIPFWDIIFFNAVPLWKAYLEAVDYFGIDAWTGGHIGLALTFDQLRFTEIVDIEYDKSRDAMIRKRKIKTPDGDLTTTDLCYRFEPPSPVEKPIKNLHEDWPKYKHLLNCPTGYDITLLNTMRKECIKSQQAFGLGIGYPGFQIWSCMAQGGIAEIAFAEYDHPEILQEWFEIELAIGTKTMEWMIAEKPDYIFFGGSGTITSASPKLAMKYALPALKKWSGMAKRAGIPTILHSCGKQMVLLDMLYHHTDVNCVNPLEIPPMGDVILAEAKQKYGDKIALMGNLHTTEIMLYGTPKDVLSASQKAIQDAGANGGFILSTGDQCGRETPDENIFAMVEAVEKYGRYDNFKSNKI